MGAVSNLTFLYAFQKSKNYLLRKILRVRCAAGREKVTKRNTNVQDLNLKDIREVEINFFVLH